MAAQTVQGDTFLGMRNLSRKIYIFVTVSIHSAALRYMRKLTHYILIIIQFCIE